MHGRNQSRKWLTCDPQSPVCEVAYVAIARRLDCIPSLLTGAAELEVTAELVRRGGGRPRPSGMSSEMSGSMMVSTPTHVPGFRDNPF